MPYRLPFKGMRTFESNFSQAGQDLFALSLLDGKRDGVFLDLGCHEPVFINNTYLLERSFGWNGLSIDIEPKYVRMYDHRRSKTMIADCTRLDWNRVIETIGTDKIDYLSLDLEPPDSTLRCLRAIPFDRVEFAVLTFEHDAYRSGEEVRAPSRRILDDAGYTRVCSNVFAEGMEFEDWYCNAKYIAADRYQKLRADKLDWHEITFE